MTCADTVVVGAGLRTVAGCVHFRLQEEVLGGPDKLWRGCRVVLLWALLVLGDTV